MDGVLACASVIYKKTKEPIDAFKSHYFFYIVIIVILRFFYELFQYFSCEGEFFFGCTVLKQNKRKKNEKRVTLLNRKFSCIILEKIFEVHRRRLMPKKLYIRRCIMLDKKNSTLIFFSKAVFVSRERERMEGKEERKFLENWASIVWFRVRVERMLTFCGTHEHNPFSSFMEGKHYFCDLHINNIFFILFYF